MKITAKETDFPIYNQMGFPRPQGLPNYSNKDFVVDLSRLNLYPDGFLCGNKQTLEKLGKFLLSTSEGRKLWNKEANYAARILNQWALDPTGFKRYIYSTFELEKLSLIYLFTGHEELGHFIREHMLHISELPYDFWLHSEIRGYDTQNPKGGLETGMLCVTVAIVASATPDLFSSVEKEQINTALKEKGLIPCVNWMSVNKEAVHNWLAVVGTGVYAASKYLNNTEDKNIAIARLNDYLNGSIEADGSYGEGVGYFDYAINSLFPAFLLMDSQERLNNFATSNLKYSASWRVSPYLFSTISGYKATILNFGDNNYSNAIISKVGVMLAYGYKDPVALWLYNKFVTSSGLMEMLFINSVSTDMPEPKSPEQAQLPLIKTFNSGDAYIRSSWKEDGIVLGMWSGNGALTNYGHQHPEMGSICMGAYGEYLIVSSGPTSYRSPLRYEWDMTTKGANTIVIDDKNQLFPESGIYTWKTVDISKYWVSGNPKAEIVQCKSGQIANLLVNEMALAYATPMESVRRSVLFLNEYFLVVDKIKAKEGVHKYSWRIHLNNRDSLGKLETKSLNHWVFTRPFANLDIYLFANQNINTNIGQGYMHGPKRDFDPGGPNEGRLGSSIEIEAHNTQNSQELTYYSIIYPTKKGSNALNVKYSNNKIGVGNDVITFNNGKCTIQKNGITEIYNLW